MRGKLGAAGRETEKNNIYIYRVWHAVGYIPRLATISIRQHRKYTIEGSSGTDKDYPIKTAQKKKNRKMRPIITSTCEGSPGSVGDGGTTAQTIRTERIVVKEKLEREGEWYSERGTSGTVWRGSAWAKNLTFLGIISEQGFVLLGKTRVHLTKGGHNNSIPSAIVSKSL